MNGLKTGLGITPGEHIISADSALSRNIRHCFYKAPDALPVVRKASWHCRQCQHDYYGERYCTHCHTGRFSEEAVAG